MGIEFAASSVFICCVAFLWCALTSAPASAARGHVFGFYFGSHVNQTAEEEGRIVDEDVCPTASHPNDKCQPGTPGSGAGQFKFSSEPWKYPATVAIDEAQDYVYVTDTGDNRVERFDSSGKYETEFDGSGTNSWEGSAPPTGRFETITGIAVDNDRASPSYGDVYVVDRGHGVIDKFSAGGAYLNQLTEAPVGTSFGGGTSPSFGAGIEGIAVDSDGRVWIYVETTSGEHAMDRCSSAVENLCDREVRLDTSFPSPGLTVDGRDDLFARVGSSEIETVDEFNASGELIQSAIGGMSGERTSGSGEPPNAVTVEASTGDAYVTVAKAIVHVTSDNSFVERLDEGRLMLASGISVDSQSQIVYVADAGAGRITVFKPEPPAAPLVREASARSVGAIDAKLEGKINSRSIEGEKATSYRFEYGSCPSIAACSTSPYVLNIEGTLPPDFDFHVVAAELRGLTQGTTYHFRLSATRVLTSTGKRVVTTGEELTFVTQPSGGEFALPDGRAWELVSPPNKHGASINPIGGGLDEAAAGGAAVTYGAESPITEEPQGARIKTAQVLSRRGSNGWYSQEIQAPNSRYAVLSLGNPFEYRLFSSDLSLGVLEPAQQNPLLTEQASGWTPYLRNDFVPSVPSAAALGEADCEEDASSCWTPLATSKSGYADVEPVGAPTGLSEGAVVGASSDLRHIVLEAPESGLLYEWSSEKPWTERLNVVGVLPDGEKVECATGGRAQLGDTGPNGDFGIVNAISREGSHIFFEVTPAASGGGCAEPALQKHLYLRDSTAGKDGESLQIDTVQPGAEEPQREAESPTPTFDAASADGSRVFFTDSQRLTEGSGRGDLYVCDITTSLPTGKEKCTLTDITPKTGAGESAHVEGTVLGISENGEDIYFVAQSALDGSGHNDVGQAAQPGQPNVYIESPNGTHYIATLEPGLGGANSTGDGADWDTSLFRTARVSPNGHWLEFMSERHLTRYDNRDVASGENDEEIYLYDAMRNKLVCASCNPTGGRPEGERIEDEFAYVNEDGFGPWKGRWLAATVPDLTRITNGQGANQVRYLSDGGRLFFDARDPLVPQAKNHRWDVYEYEPPKHGDIAESDTCTTESSSYSERDGGCISLISSGASDDDSVFVDASENGDDVFFLTASKLVGKDYDSAYDVYDAHVCGGDGSCITELASSPNCATSDSCRAAPTQEAAVFGPPPSATFVGEGDLAPMTPKPAVALRSQSRAQKLARALRVCQRMRDRRKRTTCTRRVHKRYQAVRRRMRSKGSRRNGR